MPNSTTKGATPEGVTDVNAASAAVREMFTSIAPRYDLLNHVLSMNIDRLWWRRTAKTFAPILARPDVCVLDLCCGTGDMTFALSRQAGNKSRNIIGADFAHAMLQRAVQKSRRSPLVWIEADALRMPFAGASFDLVTSAFGFRNLADYDAGLREILRVLKPGGQCGIMDFGEPTGVMGSLYRFYFRHVLPKIGTAISGVKGPYPYLPAPLEKVPEPEVIVERMRKAGFTACQWVPYSFGIAGLYRATKNTDS